MLEKRKDPRMEAKMELHISSLFKQDNDSIKINSPITITDSSPTIFFLSDTILMPTCSLVIRMTSSTAL